MSDKKVPYLALLIAFSVLQFFFMLGMSDLWDIDEGMHAVMGKNMLLTGDWITPVFNGVPFFDKPALYNWTVAVSFLVLGFTEFAARAPAAIAGLGCVILTYLIGRRAYGEKAGFIAGIVLASSLGFAITSRMVIYDVPFTFFTTLALYVFCTTLVDERDSGRRFLWFYAACGLAVLTKGPIGLLIPAMVIGLYVLLRIQWSLLKRMSIPLGVVIFFAVASPWYYLVHKANPGAMEYFLIKQNLVNFLGAAAGYVPRHPQPWHYFLPVLFIGLFPWFFLLPQSLLHAFREHAKPQREFTLVFVIWAVSTAVFFSLATSKLPTYVLPMFPAAALLIGRYCQRFLDESARLRSPGMLAGLGIGLALVSTFCAYTYVTDAWASVELKYNLNPDNVVLFFAMIAVLLGLALMAALMIRRRLALIALGAITPAMIFYLLLFIVPDGLHYRSSKEIGLAYDRLLPPGEKMVFHGQMLDSALFYTGREAIMLNSREALDEYLSADEQVFAIFKKPRHDTSVGIRGDFHIIEIFGNRALVSNFPMQED